ncbi:MAG: Gfo/Idh/MocA family oxidoreductase [Pontiella sp.]
MNRVGIIGLGFMGGVHLRNWQALNGVKVVAVCDANPNLGKVTQGNIDTGSDTLDLEGITVYVDIAEMLFNEQLDAVSITLPTHLHKTVTIQCLEAGVHVLCEKPMALNLADCDAMIAVSKKKGKQLMIAHCIRFWPEYAWVKQAVGRREYGKVLTADFTRLTYAPAWDVGSWLTDSSKSGGLALDLHIHDLDFIQYLFGIPEGIHSRCCRSKHVKTWIDYGDERVISATASWMMPESFGFQMAFNLIFEKAAVVFDGTTLSVYPSTGDSFVPEINEGDGYKGEIEYFSSLLEGKTKEIKITPEQARESVRMTLETMK